MREISCYQAPRDLKDELVNTGDEYINWTGFISDLQNNELPNYKSRKLTLVDFICIVCINDDYANFIVALSLNKKDGDGVPKGQIGASEKILTDITCFLLRQLVVTFM